MKIDLTPLSWLKKDEPKKEYCCKREILGIILAYVSVIVLSYSWIVGLIILSIASYIIWTN